jgi:tRNA-splicing ligase RtcB
MDETYDAGEFTLQKLRENVWEIPQEGDMNAPARVLASEALLDEIKEDRTLQQLVNTTHLPGIQRYALCMPDGHQGYGFPVGGVAGIDAEEGCISPGAVGYDINCLPGETEVRLSFGRRMSIDELQSRFEEEQAIVAGEELSEADIRLFTESDSKEVYQVETETGEEIRATADHEFQTPEGMVALSELQPGDIVSVHPFEGIEHETPPEFTIVSEEDLRGCSDQLLRALTDRDLLPLKSTDEAFNHLLKLVGFHLADGAFGGEGQVWFYAEPEDLQTIRQDVKAVGFTPSRVYVRERDHEVERTDFEVTEHSFKTTSRALRRLLVELGISKGPKVTSGFSAPSYLDRLATWQQALFYSAFFGAEMTKPDAQHDMNLACPKVSETRSEQTEEDGREFFENIAEFLESLDIATNTIESFPTESNADVETVRLRLGVKNDARNLIRFFSKVGYRYNRQKQREAVRAMQYLKLNEQEIERRERIPSDARAAADGGASVTELGDRYGVNSRFLERSIWSGRKARPRQGDGFPDYQSFRKQATVPPNLTTFTTIETIEPAGEETVYDLGVDHPAHNFLADQFVVSNCGVRMVRTSLSYEDLQGREEQLVDALYEAVPTGLGGGGVVETDTQTVDEVLARGVDWALEAGYAVKADRSHCEDEGFRPEADPSAVSHEAKQRGSAQLGSLGSGNHFLEVQRVTDVYREGIGDVYGLEEDQIVVLIHSGSRGLGHQVCTDYLREIEQEHADLLERLPDKELAAAPAGSRLAEEYYGAMCAAINFAWTNRQLITHQVRQVFEDVFETEWRNLEMDLLYDVAHNIAKREVHEIGGEDRELFVHRKGATRAFPAGRP